MIHDIHAMKHVCGTAVGHDSLFAAVPKDWGISAKRALSSICWMVSTCWPCKAEKKWEICCASGESMRESTFKPRSLLACPVKLWAHPNKACSPIQNLIPAALSGYLRKNVRIRRVASSECSPKILKSHHKPVQH